VQRARGLNHACLLPSRVTSWVSDQAGSAESNPAHAGWAGLSPLPKKKRSWPGLGFRPSRPKSVFAKGLFGKTRPYALVIIFMSISSLIFVQTSPFLILENSKNIWGSLLVYLWAPRTLFKFFCAYIIFFLAMWTITIKCKYVLQCFFFTSI